MGKLSLSKMLCVIFVLCVATVIASPAQTLTTLANFTQGNGAYPQASVIQGNDGNFYGTTTKGGANDYGTVFKITPSGTLTTLHSFDNSDGAKPWAPLMQATDGNFYGTTSSGSGSDGDGTVFKTTPSGTLTTLYSFDGDAGADPLAGLVQASDGNFYGTAYTGGNGGGYGSVFKITPAGTVTMLHAFTGQGDGAVPTAPLLQATDGNFYGTTYQGGNYNYGTVFKITPSGTLTTLHRFGLSDVGAQPWAGLVQASDGNFYGTTANGGPSICGGPCGTVFKITPEGTLTNFHSFNGSDGAVPYDGLVQATDGNFYGTTYSGGTNNDGTVFKITPSGTVTTLHSFAGSDGAEPFGGLVQATDGNFYGTTYRGGDYSNCSEGCGTVFKLSVGLSPFVETQPTSGTVGTPVTILGTDLTSATSVSFNGTAAVFNIVSSSEITTAVPAGATTGTVQVTTPGGTLSSSTVFQVIAPLQFLPVTPCRVVDTRNPNGQFGGPPIQGGTYRSFTIPQNPNCNIPASAAAYSLNVTVVPHAPLGYLTIWPTGEIQPFVSTMNAPDGRVKANAAIVPASNDSVSVFVTDTTDVILDIDGYFTTPGGQANQFYPLTPCRVVDTRQTSFPPGLGAPSFGNEEARELPVLRNSPCLQGLPRQPLAYSFNVTVVPHPYGQPLGYLTIWPSDQQQPYVSTLNNPTATVVANAAIVPAAANGDVSVYTFNSTDVILDVNGYFAAPASGGYSFYATAPCRAYDSRNNNGQPFVGEKTVNVVGSACAPPGNAKGYVFNATVVPSGFLDYLTLWPDGQTQPVVSTLNAYDGLVTSNMAIVPTTNGSIDGYASQLTHLILDLSGYFAP